MKSIRRLFIVVLLLTVNLTWLGCGNNPGLPRYALSGAARLADDQPIPVGEVLLEPDAAAGNQGPSSVAPIRDGSYSLPSDQGVVGGKYIATILAFDGIAFGESTQGKPLIRAPYVEKLDLPKADSKHDFTIKKE